MSQHAEPAIPVGTRGRRTRRIVLLVLCLVVLLPLAAAGILLATFDPNAYKPQIENAVQRATGRQLALRGPLHLRFTPGPAIAAGDVAFANMPGGSRPEMATLESLNAELALLPLLSGHVEIDSLTLTRPDILLETDAAGRANWQLRPAQKEATPAAPSRPGEARVAVRRVRITEGRLTYRDGASGRAETVGIGRLAADVGPGMGPLDATADLTYRNVPLSLRLATGPLARLSAPAGDTPWPLRLAVAAAGGNVTLDGAMTRPAEARGYDVKLAASVPDTARLAPLLPSAAHLPALHDVVLSAHLVDAGRKLPEMGDLSLAAGASDLSAYVPGLQLASLHVTAPKSDQPVSLLLDAAQGGTPMRVAGTLGTPAALMGGAAFPVALSAFAGSAKFGTRGTVGAAPDFAGTSLGVSARVPDLAALSPLARRPLPPVRDLAFDATVGEQGGNGQHGVALHGLRVTSSAGDLAGDLAYAPAPRPTLRGTLTAQRLDLDALRPPAAPGTAAPAQAPPRPAAPPPAHVIPDTPLPFDVLRTADSDLAARIGDLHTGGGDYRNVAFHLGLSDGHLALSPFAADTPTGHVSGELSADATRPAPAVGLVLRAPGLALHDILALLHEPADARGLLQVDAALNGAGRTPHEIASTLDGHLGLSLVDGEVEGKVIGQLFGDALRAANLSGYDGEVGRTTLRCFALRLDAAHGQGHVGTLLLDTRRLRIEGGGGIDLANETLALHLKPLLRSGGNGIVLPVRLSGPWRHARAEIDPTGVPGPAGQGRLGLLFGALRGDAGPEDCAAALAAARGGQPGPQPQGAPPAPAQQGGRVPDAAVKPPKPADLLRSLLR